LRYLFICYLAALLISLFISSWRLAFLAVAGESLLTGLILIKTNGFESWPTRIQVCDLIFVRAVIVPLFLMSLLKKIKSEIDYDIIPANFVIWIFAIMLLIVSFWFGQILSPYEVKISGYIGLPIAGALIGIFILANQISIIGQILGILTLEASIVLTEVISNHHQTWGLQLGLSFVFIWMILIFWSFLKHFSVTEGLHVETVSSLLEEKDVL
jgi:hydrogenase-4 membrane subunit HyfE